MKNLIFGIGTILTFQCLCLAQQITSIHITKYAQEQGLGTYNIRKVYEDSRGFLWVATQDGLYRFDGKQFTAYTKGAVPKRRLCGAEVRSIVEDTTRNLLWVLPSEYGINAISTVTGSVVTTIPIPRQHPDEWNLAMLLHNHMLYICQANGVRVFNTLSGLFEVNLKLPGEKTAGKGAEARSICIDKYRRIWVGYTDLGVVVYNGQSHKIENHLSINDFRFSNAETKIRFFELTPMDNFVLIATINGLRKVNYSKDSYSCENRPGEFKPFYDARIETIFTDWFGRIYISGFGRLLRFEDVGLKKYEKLISDDGVPSEVWLGSVQCIFQSRNGILWMGCQQGLTKFNNRPSPFVPFLTGAASKIQLGHVRSLFKTDAGAFLIGLRNGLVKTDSISGFKNIQENGLFHHIFRGPDAKTHLASDKGMFVFESDKLTPINKLYAEFSGYQTDAYNSHVFIGDSIVVLGSEYVNGILIWNYKRHTVKRIDDTSGTVRLASATVNNIFYDALDRLWVLSDNTITIISNNFLIAESFSLIDRETKIPLNLFFDMQETNESYWICSYGTGIIELSKTFKIKKIYGIKDGLSNPGVYQIFAKENNLLITTNSGLSVLNTKTKKFSNFFKSDGLHSNGFEEVCGYSEGNMVYAGGLEGFTAINVSLMKNNTVAPQLYINHISTEGSGNTSSDTSNISFSDFNIPARVARATVSFSAINFINPERTTFKYRITELSDSLIDNGVLNYVSLPRIGPGIYHLEVQAFNESGVGSEVKTLTLRFLPKWFQTLGFKIGVGLLLFGMVYALYRYRIAQIRKQHQIRKDIASDLHDDIGSTLNSVKVFTHLAIEGKNKEAYLEQAKENLSQASASLRDMIWVLDDKLDTIEQLSARLQQFVMPLAHAMGLEVVFNCTPEAQEYRLHKNEKRNLLLICKESINNSIKYAGASLLQVTIGMHNKKPHIHIQDNGKGFDMNNYQAGNGIKNLQYRGQQIGYTVTVQSAPGKGTEITVSA